MVIFHRFLYVYQRVYHNTFPNSPFFNEEHEVVIHWVLGYPIFRQTHEFLGGKHCFFLDGKSWILGWTFHGLFFFMRHHNFWDCWVQILEFFGWISLGSWWTPVSLMENQNLRGFHSDQTGWSHCKLGQLTFTEPCGKIFDVSWRFWTLLSYIYTYLFVYIYMIL